MINVTPVILCGGSGSRLWPLSRTGFPKQFLSLTGDDSLFQQVTKRIKSLGTAEINIANPLVVTGEDHRFLVVEQLREINNRAGVAILEPEARNTAPALTLAAISSLEDGVDSVLIVIPSDQIISNQIDYNSTLSKAIAVANEGGIIILGVEPESPEAGYGYIQTKIEIGDHEEKGVHSVLRFVEKPDILTAQKYIDQGGFFWNAGIFVLKASTWIKALKVFNPVILKNCFAAWENRTQDEYLKTFFIRPGRKEYSAIDAISIDYAVMEHCPGSEIPMYMIPLNAGWSDLGSWDSVWSYLDKDSSGNASIGDVIVSDTNNTLIHASSRLVSLLGVDDLIVVENSDAVLIANKKKSQDVKILVDKLKARNRREYAIHRKVFRPWGWFDNLEESEKFKVKHILVKPKSAISLQKHEFRSEHWIVVKGIAEVTNGNKIFQIKENESTYIPIGQIHRLKNIGDVDLEIIEVQTGTYLGEDDIIRIEDTYGRVQA